MAQKKCNVVVVGAGVVGLTTAYLLAKDDASVSVTVVARHMPGDVDIEYASPFAGANFLPVAALEDGRWESRTWPWLQRLAREVPAAGVHFQKCRIYRPAKVEHQHISPSKANPFVFPPNPWWATLVPDYRELSATELPPGNDFSSGAEFTSVCINAPLYLCWLKSQCLSHGVVFRRATLPHILSARAHSAHDPAAADVVVVNATGLGSLRLGGVHDETMQPARGQTILVRGETSAGTMFIWNGPEGLGYAMTRAAGGGTLLGGTFELGDWREGVDSATAERIVSAAVRVDPGIKGEGRIDVVRHAVGRRPWRRDGVRIEREWVEGVEKENKEDKGGSGGCWVVHNYGHSGWGFQGSYGCAERVVELVAEARKEMGGK